MKILGTLDALAGRLLLPSYADAPATPTASQLWLTAGQLFFRHNTDEQTLRVLTDADMGVAEGLATLGEDGLVPTAQLPSTVVTFGVPIGGVFDWPGDPNVLPDDCLVCDGTEYLRADYPSLSAILRSRWGYPTNDLYFRVPNFVGRARYGAWAGQLSGMVRRVDIWKRGTGYTPGTYNFTFTGGTFTTAATGRVIIANETVPMVGVTGVVQRVEITTPGEYSSFGSAGAGTADNCALVIPGAALPGGSGFQFDVFGQPDSAPYARWSVQMNDHGSGYTSPPRVSITGASLTGATAYAIVRDGGVAAVVVTNPGLGSNSGATVTFSGGGGSGASASTRTETRYMLTADYVGEEEHNPLESELVSHDHVLVTNQGDGDDDGGPRRNNNGENEGSVTTEDAGEDYNVPVYPPGAGVLPLIRAV